MQSRYLITARQALLCAFILTSCAAWGQSFKSVQNCPPTPNCVSSNPAADDEHHVLPFRIEGPKEVAWETLRKVLKSMERAVIVEDGYGYVRVEVTSLVFRFVDDVEFQADPENHLIQVRSASRVGYWDLGVNRKRIESLRKQLLKLGVIG